MTDSTTISSDGERIELNIAERSFDAANRPMYATSNLIAERLTVTSAGGARQLVRVSIEDFEAVSIALSTEQAAELRDWLIGLNLS